MCQEVIKIRDEDELESESMHNVLKQPLVRIYKLVVQKHSEKWSG